MDDTQAVNVLRDTITDAVKTVGTDDNKVQFSKDGAYSYVTNTDEKLDSHIRGRLMQETEYSVLSEESDSTPPGDEYWVIDPIDGTAPFAHDLPTYVSMGSFVTDGVPIASVLYAPETDDMYTADASGAYRNGTEITTTNESLHQSGVFCTESFSKPDKYLDFCQQIKEQCLVFTIKSSGFAATATASGGTTAGIHARLHPWDYFPTVHLVESAGGTVGCLSTGNTGIEAIIKNNGANTCLASSSTVFNDIKSIWDNLENSD